MAASRRGQAWNYRSSRCEPSPPGPVDLIRVDKSAHRMAVYRQGRLVREFRVAIGRGDPGPKQRQGDGRVPEGTYRITAHNPDSAYPPLAADRLSDARANRGREQAAASIPAATS